MAKHASERVLRPSERRRRRSRYIAALDGLRAFAVLAVIFYHMGLNWAPGGLMGVTVFFVISGYLINGLLVAEFDANGSISLPQFWLRRVRRIIPAVLLALAGTLVLCALVSPALFDKARDDLVPSLFFFNNWWQVFHNVSYFEAAAAPSPLTHYWSLAIEEQFYIVWPLLLLALLKLHVPKKALAVIIGVLAVTSFGEMALMYSPMADPSRIYYGTDTRAGSLLIGCLLALAWPSTIFGKRRAQPQSAPGRFGFNLLGVAALAALVLIVAFSNSYTSFPYLGGIALVSVLTAVLITALVVPNTWVARLMQLKPLVWIGKRSYGMYLWHYPIILATSKITSTIEVPWWVRVSQIIVIFAVSDLSYRFVEEPIRSGALRAWWNRRNERPSAKRPRPHRARTRATVCTCAALACAAGIALAVMPPASSAIPQSALASTTQAQSESASPSASSTANSLVAAQSGSAGTSSASSGKQEPGSSNGSEASSPASASTSSASPSSASSAKVESSSTPAASSSAASPSSGSSSAASKSSSSSSKSAAASDTASKSAASESSSVASKSATSASSSASSSSSKSSKKKSSSAKAAKKSASASAKAAKKSESASAAASSASAPLSAKASSGASDAKASDARSEESAEPKPAQLITETLDAVSERADGLTDDERTQAREILAGPIERIVQSVGIQIEESIREKERQRREQIYEDLFETQHLNDAGALIFDPLLIGDSVAAGCENEFYRVFPYGHSDAEVSRNIWESPYAFYSENNQVGEYVVFCLGTNNAVIDEQIDEVLDIVGPKKKVILVNVRCPRDWEAQTNQAIANAPQRHSNIVAVVDWYGESAGHDEYFYEDGIHVNEVGAKAYIALIQQAIENSIE